jgi:hypothetical protein
VLYARINIRPPYQAAVALMSAQVSEVMTTDFQAWLRDYGLGVQTTTFDQFASRCTFV